MKITFNCRLRYDEVQDCIEEIKKHGGDGNITVGGSWFTGSVDAIDKLIAYMGDKNYDLESMQIDRPPLGSTKEDIEKIKKDHGIK